MPKMICICILLIYFKVISKKGGHYCSRLPYIRGQDTKKLCILMLVRPLKHVSDNILLSLFRAITWTMMLVSGFSKCSKSQYSASICIIVVNMLCTDVYNN